MANNTNIKTPIEHQESTHSSVTGILRLSLNAAGISGVFAAVGYIALIAHQEFLGIPLDADSVTKLSFSAASFWFDTLRILLEQVQIHYLVSTTIVIIIIFLSYIRSKVGNYGHIVCDIYQLSIIFMAIVVGSSSLLLYELPSIKISDVLVVNINTQPRVGYSNIIDRRTNQLWSWVVGARVDGEDSTQHDVRYESKTPKEDAKCKLKDGYALTLIAVVIGWLLVYQRPNQLEARWMASFRKIAVFELAVCTLLVPYTYGKLISSTTMPNVSVMLKHKSESMASVARQPKEVSSAAKGYLLGETLLVAENDRRVLVLSFKEDAPLLVEIPRNEIERIEIHENTDAITKLISLPKSITAIP